MKKINKIIFGDFGLVFILHLILILAFYFSPFLFSWKIVAIFLVYIYFQEIFFQGCLLSFFQFGKKHKKLPIFHFYYLEKIGLSLNKKALSFIIVWLLPLGIFLFSFFWQVVFFHNPYLIF